MTTATIATIPAINPSNNVAYITKQELIELLLDIRGASFITFVTTTQPKANKKHRDTGLPNPYATILHEQKVNCLIGFDYNKAVERRLDKEGKSPDEFSQGQSFHQPIFTDNDSFTPFAIHKADSAAVVGWQSIVMKADNSGPNSVASIANDFHVSDMEDGQRIYLRVELRAGLESRYIADGTEVDYDDIKGYLPKPSTYENQGLDDKDKVRFMTYGLEGITSVNMNKNTYLIRG